MTAFAQEMAKMISPHGSPVYKVADDMDNNANHSHSTSHPQVTSGKIIHLFYPPLLIIMNPLSISSKQNKNTIGIRGKVQSKGGQ